ncbi:hypothetical protein CXG81DRAFT_21531, partial [Caulochytrium protostelioides]
VPSTALPLPWGLTYGDTTGLNPMAGSQAVPGSGDISAGDAPEGVSPPSHPTTDPEPLDDQGNFANRLSHFTLTDIGGGLNSYYVPHDPSGFGDDSLTVVAPLIDPADLGLMARTPFPSSDSFASLNDPIASSTVGGSVTEIGDMTATPVRESPPTNHQESSNSRVASEIQNRGLSDSWGPFESFPHTNTISSDVQAGNQVPNQLYSPPTTWLAYREKIPVTYDRRETFEPDTVRTALACVLHQSTGGFQNYFKAMTADGSLQTLVFELYGEFLEKSTPKKKSRSLDFHPILYVRSAAFVTFCNKGSSRGSLTSDFSQVRAYAESIKAQYIYRWYINVWESKIKQATVDTIVLWLYLEYFCRADSDQLSSEKEFLGSSKAWREVLSNMEAQLEVQRKNEMTYRQHLIKEFVLQQDSSSDDLREIIRQFAELLQGEDSQVAKILKMLSPDCSKQDMEDAALKSMRRSFDGLNIRCPMVN